MKVYLDTNIIIDILERREPHYGDSKNVKDFTNSPIPVISPIDFLNIVQTQ